MDLPDKPATMKELNQLQLEILEKLYDSQARVEQKLNDLSEQVLPRIAVLEALGVRDKEDREDAQNTGLSNRSTWWLAAGVIVAFLVGVVNTVVTIISIHVHP